ncbi:MAG: hypothetical protein N3F09_03140 [Bacteroidia bacterium]|nr:hypothetical protein [Bacteroidia bacterium]
MALFLVLFFLPRSKAKNHFEESVVKNSSVSISSFVKDFAKSIPVDIKKKYDSSAFDFNSKVKFWQALNRPMGVAYEWAQHALITKADTSWSNAGKWFVRMAMLESINEEKKNFYNLALEAFDKALELNPGNKEHLMDKGTVLVESGLNPMEGIGMLKKLEANDSNNVELLVRLARFSMQSGQTEKAIQRLTKAINIDSMRLDAHLYLADAYRQNQNIPNSLKHLKFFAARTLNPEEKKAAEEFIRELENQIMSNP